MTDATDPPDDVPPDVADRLADLDTATLRRTIAHARRLVRERQEKPADAIEAGPNEELVRVTERDGYTEVVKREPCADGCADCPHEAYLYHVHTERRPDGTSKLVWDFIGPANE